tara:strand:- start:94 stop:669 length:576 start_codon:yes stop_codon:yes gene_type:complete
MIINEHKTIFIHIPKNAGTSIESIFKPCVKLNKLIDRHATIYDIKNKLPNIYKKYNKFAIVRNPYERMVSWYHYLKTATNARTIITLKTWDASFNEWVDNIEEVTAKYLPNHLTLEKELLKPQYNWVDETVTILKYENLNKELNCFFNKDFCLPIKNKTKHNNYLDYYNNESLNIVYNKYKEDFKKYNYKK